MGKIYGQQMLKKRSRNSSWKNILLAIYNYAPTWYEWGNIFETTHNLKHPIANKLKITDKELSYGIAFLQQNKLIRCEQINNAKAFIVLEEKGFNVALEIEKHIDSQKANNTIITLTTILAIISFYEITYKVLNNFNANSFILLLILGIIIAGLSLAAIKMSA